MDDIYRTARRATTGRTVLSSMAALFLAASLAFWGVLHWTVFVVPGAGVPQIIVAVVMTLIYAAALPLLLSMLVPTTPAGQMLQKTQWRTIGFPVIIACAAFLGWHARNLMMSWFAAQPTVAAAQLESAYTIAGLIGFVVIPALAWVQVTPERWLAEIQQAHLVKKLEMEQSGELAIIKARLLWAEQKAAIGYARLLPAEQKEVRDTLRGLLMGIADTQRGIVRTLGISGDLEQTIMGDQDIADTLHYVEQQMEKPAQLIDRNLTYFDDQDRESHVATIEEPQPDLRTRYDRPNGTVRSTPAAIERGHVDSRLQPSIPRAASRAQSGTVGHSPALSDDDMRVYVTVRSQLPAPFTAKQLAELMLWQDERPAQRVIREWRRAGMAEEVRLGRYNLTEREE